MNRKSSQLPSEMIELVKSAREHLIDSICETDDELLMQRLEGEEISTDKLKSALRKAVIAGEIVPVLCGATRERIGVQPLLKQRCRLPSRAY